MADNSGSSGSSGNSGSSSSSSSSNNSGSSSSSSSPQKEYIDCYPVGVNGDVVTQSGNNNSGGNSDNSDDNKKSNDAYTLVVFIFVPLILCALLVAILYQVYSRMFPTGVGELVGGSKTIISGGGTLLYKKLKK